MVNNFTHINKMNNHHAMLILIYMYKCIIAKKI